MTWHHWIAFVAVASISALAPGPAVFYVLSHGLAWGRRAALLAAAGILAANVLFFALSGLGLGAVLIAYNWPKGSDRYNRLVSFVDHFFPRIAEFQKPPRHVKWRETNLAAKLPGWTRFPYAEDWLQKNRPQVAAALDVEHKQFNEFIASRGSGSASLSAGGTFDEREQLFQEFIRWKQAHDRR